jgi:hypothetical protein
VAGHALRYSMIAGRRANLRCSGKVLTLVSAARCPARLFDRQAARHRARNEAGMPDDITELGRFVRIVDLRRPCRRLRRT